MATKKEAQRVQRRAPLGAARVDAKQSAGRTTATSTPFLLRARGLELDPSVRAYMEKRVGFKLARFALSIERALVRLERESGPTGEATFACRFEITTSGGGKVIVEAREQDARAAFDTANDSAERAVRRLLERRVAKKVRRPAGSTGRRGGR
jgi:ribosome-associated translation inhibitor RaiA